MLKLEYMTKNFGKNKLILKLGTDCFT
jgi:hypothetical protein